LIATFQGGVQKILDSRRIKKGKSSSDAIYENSQNMTGYLKIGISINPFD